MTISRASTPAGPPALGPVAGLRCHSKVRPAESHCRVHRASDVGRRLVEGAGRGGHGSRGGPGGRAQVLLGLIGDTMIRRPALVDDPSPINGGSRVRVTNRVTDCRRDRLT